MDIVRLALAPASPRGFLADGAGSPLDQGVTSFLLIGAFLLGWLAVSRLRGRGFHRLPRAAAWVAAAGAAACVVLAVVLPPIISPNQTTRPRSTATVQILSPQRGEVFHGNPATVPVVLRLVGGQISTRTSTHLTPDQGHIHVLIDGAIVSMVYALRTTVEVAPGPHVMVAEFVALDHGPFDPRVLATTSFDVEP